MKKLIFVLLLTGCDTSYTELRELKDSVADCRLLKGEVDRLGPNIKLPRQISNKLKRCKEIGAIE